MNKQKTIGWFLPYRSIDDIFMSRTDGIPHVAVITVFYHDHDEEDREINFKIFLN